jgi:ubiquinone/menaquinone biosynthesis C-methylase UbiE
MSSDKSNAAIKDAVKKHYGTAIKNQTSCCSGSAPIDFDPEAAGRFAQMSGYSTEDLKSVPSEVASFGCGNPVNFINVKPGQVVLDLGSGAGLDLILAARKVGETGRAIGLDMTPEMIEICRKNIDKAGLTNAEVRQGEMEKMPVADAEVDWIISNCVINLSPEKEKVFAEAFRVLKPGGEIMVSDIVTINLPEEYRDDITAWVGCIAGAVEEDEYIRLVKEAGFTEVKIVDKMLYDGNSVSTLASDACGCGPNDKPVDKTLLNKYANHVASVKLSAKKPG